jgi:surface antigen
MSSLSLVGRIGGAAVLAVAIAASPVPGFAQSSTYGIDRGTCDRSALSGVFSTSTNNLIGSAVGAAAGGLLGSQFGGGSGKATMTVVGVLAGALAGGYVGRSMDPVDQGCVSRALEHAPTQQTVAWQNPDTGASYRVTPTRTYQERNGTPCREYTTTAVIDGRQEQVYGTACRQPDGAWKVQNQ